MANWQTENPVTWWIEAYWALWDSAISKWNDLVVSWNSTENHNWNSDNSGDWYTKV